jgi:hypothetical protein
MAMERTTEAEALKFEPSLSEAPAFPDLKLEEFRGVPVQDPSVGNQNSNSNSMGGVGTLLNAILN